MREAGVEAVTDELVGAVVEAVRPVRPNGHGASWELLLAMLAMEAAFGIGGVVAAPIYYAYVKRELSAVQLA